MIEAFSVIFVTELTEPIDAFSDLSLTQPGLSSTWSHTAYGHGHNLANEQLVLLILFLLDLKSKGVLEFSELRKQTLFFVERLVRIWGFKHLELIGVVYVIFVTFLKLDHSNV